MQTLCYHSWIVSYEWLLWVWTNIVSNNHGEKNMQFLKSSYPKFNHLDLIPDILSQLLCYPHSSNIDTVIGGVANCVAPTLSGYICLSTWFIYCHAGYIWPACYFTYWLYMQFPDCVGATGTIFPGMASLNGGLCFVMQETHDDVIKWKHFPLNWPLIQKYNGLRWIPLTKASDAELWCFLWSAPE